MKSEAVLGQEPEIRGWKILSAMIPPLAVFAAASSLSPWMRMVLMVSSLFYTFKLITLPRRRRLAYLLPWPGMDPRPFEGERRPDPAAPHLVAWGLMWMAIGALLLVYGSPLLAVIAMLLIVHIGAFDALAGAWRWYGLPVGSITPSPWLSRSLTEFWGKRWNMAFHVFVRDQVYRPLARRWGRSTALAAVFAFSALLHEFVISFPAGGGWGLPTLYFAVHGLAVWLEKRGTIRPNRFLTWTLVLGPAPILFHAPFLSNVVYPVVIR